MLRGILFLKFISLSLLLLLSFYGCSSYNHANDPSISGDINDSASWYPTVNDELLTLRVSVETPNSALCSPYDDKSAAQRACTLEDINNDLYNNDDYEPYLNVIASTDNFATNVTTPNATLKVRGDYSRTLEQKSYAVKLDSKTDLLNGERKLQINKHQSDMSRVKNKLSFDLFIDIPHIISLKTRFVNLFIDGVDYGLFTHVEAANEEFLLNRNLGKNDNIYKTNVFQFKQYDQLAVDGSGSPLDQAAFETILEIGNGEDHSKLLEMLNAVNSNTDIDKVVEKYFNRNNYLTWMAINLILGNKDTTYHNFSLYNPAHSDTFYFLPWDYDGAWSTTDYLGKSEYGISVWWDVPLHKKFLSIKKNRDDLYAMVDTLREKYITDEIIQSRLSSYESTVKPFILSYPDSLNVSENSWREATDYLVDGIEYNIELYKSVIGHPMPFWQNADYTDGTLSLSWDESVDLEGDDVVYDLLFADNPDMTDPIIELNSLTSREYKTDISLQSGSYFMQVTSREKNDSTHFQIAFDRDYQLNDKVYYGILELEVK